MIMKKYQLRFIAHLYSAHQRTYKIHKFRLFINAHEIENLLKRGYIKTVQNRQVYDTT